MKQNSFRIFLGFFADGFITPYQKISETVTTTDTVTYTVIAVAKDTCRTPEYFDVYYSLLDYVAIEEVLDARGKGAVKTLYISDERYFKKKNA